VSLVGNWLGLYGVHRDESSLGVSVGGDRESCGPSLLRGAQGV
jgi:hypothetical protein